MKSKLKVNYTLDSYGIYTNWDRDAKSLPRIRKHTRTVPARIGIEFGYVLNLKKAKGKRLDFRIEHPPFKGADGKTAPPFTGEVYVRTNNWNFFLGDTIWEPADDKVGPWRLVTEMDGHVIADETILLVEDDGQYPEFGGAA